MTKRRSYVPVLEEHEVPVIRTGNRSLIKKPEGSGIRLPKGARHGKTVS